MRKNVFSKTTAILLSVLLPVLSFCANVGAAETEAAKTKLVNPTASGFIVSETAVTITVDAPGNYIIQTALPANGLYEKEDTVLSLYDEKTGLLLAQNDNYEFNGQKTDYSRLLVSLFGGKSYTLKVAGKSKPLTASYLTIHKAGELYVDTTNGMNTSFFSELCKDFEKIAPASDKYNCLSYALGINYMNTWPWESEPSVNDVDIFMTERGYMKTEHPNENCIVAYGKDDKIVHFSMVSNGIVTAKLGTMELVRHFEIDTYFSDSEFGKPLAFYVKQL